MATLTTPLILARLVNACAAVVSAHERRNPDHVGLTLREEDAIRSLLSLLDDPEIQDLQ